MARLSQFIKVINQYKKYSNKSIYKKPGHCASMIECSSPCKLSDPNFPNQVRYVCLSGWGGPRGQDPLLVANYLFQVIFTLVLGTLPPTLVMQCEDL